MNFSSPAALPAPSIAFHAVKPVKVAAPKLSKISITKMGNGASVMHHFTGGAKPKNFIFTNPTLMNKHIKRAINTEWLNPMGGPAQEAKKIDTALNV